jgi:fatty acid desaturase
MPPALPRVDRTPIYDAYRRTLLPSDEVRRLSVPRPDQAVRDAALAWLVILGAWGIVAIVRAWWIVPLAFPVVGAAYYGLFIIGHDGLHRRIFAGRRANDFFNDAVILGAIGAITRINNHNHLRHHNSLAMPHDPDRHKYACVNKYDEPHLVAYLSGLSSVWRAVWNVFGRTSVKGTAREAYTLRDFLILAGWQAALIGGLTVWIGWWAWPVLWLAPVYCFTYLMDNLRTFAEHSHPEADTASDRHRLIHYDGTWVERIFIAPLQMNHHAAHHLWPSRSPITTSRPLPRQCGGGRRLKVLFGAVRT